MAATVKLEDIRRALEARDPSLSYLVQQLAESADPTPETPVREGALTYASFQQEIQSWSFRRKSREEQRRYRVDTLKALEAPGAEVPLPDRLKLHEVLLGLWADNGAFARRALLEVIATTPLRYGAWRALKRIFKESEERGDWEIYGALVARLDREYAVKWNYNRDVTIRTIGYMARRAWRQLRRLAESMPSSYADVASAALAHYPEETEWGGVWVASHIFYHDTKKYNRYRFNLPRRGSMSLLKHRAYAELWQRSPRPLFSLLERAKSEQIRRYAAECLRTDFRASIREVEPGWVARLVGVGSAVVDEFVVWVLESVPRFEQAAFRELGLHEAVLKLLDSPAGKAQEYAAAYARAHARDLSVDELVRLAGSSSAPVRKLAFDLLGERDPRKDVGLDAWGRLLEQSESHEFAAGVLRKHFGARELTPDWFKPRLFSQNWHVVEFAKGLLLTVHPPAKLGAAWFAALLDDAELKDQAASFILDTLERFEPTELGEEGLRRLFVHPSGADRAVAWVDQGRLKFEALGSDFAKALAYEPTWDASAWVADLKASGPPWSRDIEFNHEVAESVLGWLGDVRRFSPEDLGFDWLMQLVQRSEPHYHEFAVELMIKAFAPADFAEKKAAEAAAPAAAAAAGPVTVDLGGASFLFTGEMATMDRKVAEAKVRAAGGAVASGVNKNLNYLVIGDEGSPLYGQGRKGSKQTKAEELIAKGVAIKIISETAFLQMLSGEQREFSAGDVEAGCERLWSMATAPGPEDSPLASFALQYLRRHHADIVLAETDRPVDPGMEIPADFLTFERVRPLYSDERLTVREFALELSRWEFARWAPPIDALVGLAENPFEDVRTFVTQALLADTSPEHKRYRVDPARLTPDAVYAFCESAREAARQIGMQLIAAHPRLQVPEELFRLSESPDRNVRAFVIRTIWSMYRDRGVKAEWKPAAPKAAPSVGKKVEERDRGPGVPKRPEALPAEHAKLGTFMRRVLYEIPPAKLEKRPGAQKLKPLPARKAKLALVEVLRDLAVEDATFAAVVFPLLEEFMGSHGPSERAACLVATTRIRRAHPALVEGR